MSGSEIRSKRMQAGIAGAIICTKTGISRNRLVDIERGYVTATDDEISRLDAAIDEIVDGRRKLAKLADEAGLSLVEARL
jgi:transcriptional regulator with XRE-family HTH domain